jgi:hypothetical protein
VVTFLCTQYLAEGAGGLGVVPEWVIEALVHSTLFPSELELVSLLQNKAEEITATAISSSS